MLENSCIQELLVSMSESYRICNVWNGTSYILLIPHDTGVYPGHLFEDFSTPIKIVHFIVGGTMSFKIQTPLSQSALQGVLLNNKQRLNSSSDRR